MFNYYQQGISGEVEEIKISPIDKYIIGHIAWGGVLAYLGVPFWGALALSVAWEIIEQPLKVHVPSLFPEPIRDPFGNQVMDTVGVLAGWGIIRYAIG